MAESQGSCEMVFWRQDLWQLTCFKFGRHVIRYSCKYRPTLFEMLNTNTSTKVKALTFILRFHGTWTCECCRKFKHFCNATSGSRLRTEIKVYRQVKRRRLNMSIIHAPICRSSDTARRDRQCATETTGYIVVNWRVARDDNGETLPSPGGRDVWSSAVGKGL